MLQGRAFVGCLLGCYRKNKEHMAAQRMARRQEAEMAGARGAPRLRNGRAAPALRGDHAPARITISA